jgi:hypothetical protein
VGESAREQPSGGRRSEENSAHPRTFELGNTVITICAQKWCRRRESNPRPRDYETLALPLSYAGTKQLIMLRSPPMEVKYLPADGPGAARHLWRFQQAPDVPVRRTPSSSQHSIP